MTGMALRVVRTDGILALYSGLSASLCRQVCGGCQSRTPHDPSGLPDGLSPAVGIQATSSLFQDFVQGRTYQAESW